MSSTTTPTTTFVLRSERAGPPKADAGRREKPQERPGSEAASQAPVCPMSGLLETLTRPWTLHILWVLSTQGPTRFGALRRGVHGISSRVLTERLRGLEEAGFVYREYKPTIPPEVTYGITKRMKDIEKVLKQLDALAQKWKMEDGVSA